MIHLVWHDGDGQGSLDEQKSLACCSPQVAKSPTQLSD